MSSHPSLYGVSRPPVRCRPSVLGGRRPSWVRKRPPVTLPGVGSTATGKTDWGVSLSVVEGFDVRVLRLPVPPEE